jgi:hypothetical protein
MTDPEQSINRILSGAANNLRIPTETAQLIMMVGAELLAHRSMIHDQAGIIERQGDAITRLIKEIARLKGVHGA